MKVGTTARSGAVGSGSVAWTGPVRTCVGCRARAAASELLRVVAGDVSVIPDPQHRLAGRGAYIHLQVGCLDLALRRRAWTRALRVAGALDDSLLRDMLAASEDDE
ncbi:MAG: YlxR family protein [Actinomycetales bacterium]|nr:YlxR family protein [Actinomycetales bacterium]